MHGSRSFAPVPIPSFTASLLVKVSLVIKQVWKTVEVPSQKTDPLTFSPSFAPLDLPVSGVYLQQRDPISPN